MSVFSTFKPETSANTQESEQHDLFNQENVTENKLYLAEDNFSAQKIEKAEVMFRWKSNKKKCLARFARWYLSASTSSVYSKRFFSEAGNL